MENGKKIEVNAQFVSLNYLPEEGWGRHRQLIQSHLQFKRKSGLKVILANPFEYSVEPREKIIFMSTWEADKLPHKTVELANKLAVALIVPSNWVKQVFITSGVKVPIFVCPEGITDNSIFYPERSPFTFLHFDATSHANRKGGDLVKKAFLDVFANIDDVQLIMKGREHTVPFPVTPHDKIKYIFKNYSEEEMIGLWKKTHCFVFPSRGEGFGLPPLEAMGHGIPTIYTNGSAMQDYGDFGIKLRIFGKTPSVYLHNLDDESKWDVPDFEQLKELMWRVYKEYAIEKGEAIKQAKEVWETYNFASVASQLAQIINNLAVKVI